MDSTNNPTPTSNPDPNLVSNSAPVSPEEPTLPNSPLTVDSFQSATSASPTLPASSVTPSSTPVSPVVSPVTQVSPTSTSATQVPSVSQPTTPVSPMPENHVKPTVSAPNSTSPVASVPRPAGAQNDLTFAAPRPATTPVEVPVPVHPVINPTKTSEVAVNPIASNGVSATDPIIRQEATHVSDPVESELNAPMKAAAPVPGSIGSAVSGPATTVANETDQGMDEVAMREEALINSVAFNDPAKQTEQSDKTDSKTKKTDKKTLIALIIVAAMVVIALVAVFALQLFNTSSSSTESSSSSTSSVDDSDVSSDTTETDDTGTSVSSNVSSVVCSVDGIMGVEEQGIESTTIVYKIVENKLVGADVDYVVVGENGSSNTVTETLTLDEMFDDSEVVGDDFMEVDGTLKVTPQVFADEMTRLVRESGSGESLTCVVR